MISSTRPPPSAITVPSKLQTMPSPIESKLPSLPHRQTLAVAIRFWNAFAWLVMRQLWAIGAV